MTKVPWSQLTSQSKIAIGVGIALLVIGFATLFAPFIWGGAMFCYGGSRNMFGRRDS